MGCRLCIDGGGNTINMLWQCGSRRFSSAVLLWFCGGLGLDGNRKCADRRLYGTERQHGVDGRRYPQLKLRKAQLLQERPANYDGLERLFAERRGGELREVLLRPGCDFCHSEGRVGSHPNHGTVDACRLCIDGGGNTINMLWQCGSRRFSSAVLLWFCGGLGLDGNRKCADRRLYGTERQHGVDGRRYPQLKLLKAGCDFCHGEGRVGSHSNYGTVDAFRLCHTG